MATLAAAAARQLATSSRISTARNSSLPSNIIHRRGLAGAAGNNPKFSILCVVYYLISDLIF